MAENRRVILVAGMHRSGTSAVARFLNLLGPSLPDDIIPASPNNNRLGFWEPRQMVEINNAIFAQMEMVWHSLGPLPPDWESRPELDELRQRASTMISDLQDGEYILKDPRLSRLMPFWNAIFKSHDIPVSIVIPYRNPLEVCLSLSRRDWFPISKGMMLWLRYNLDAEFWSRNSPRLFISFNELLANPAGTFAECADRLSGSVQCRWENVAEDVQKFLDLGEKHYSFDIGEIREIDQTVCRVFEALDQEDSVCRRVLDEVRQGTQKIDRLVGDVLNQYEWGRGLLQRKIRRLESSFVDTGQANSEKADDALSETKAVDTYDQQPNLFRAQQKLDSLLERLETVQASIDARVRLLESRSEPSKDDSVDQAKSNTSKEVNADYHQSEEQYEGQSDDWSNWREPGGEPEGSGTNRLARLLVLMKQLTMRAVGRANRLPEVPPELVAEAKEIWQSKWFDADWYLNTYPDVKQAGVDPALHFAMHGWKESRDPCPNFSVTGYLESYPDVREDRGNPLLHFIRFGEAEGRVPTGVQPDATEQPPQPGRSAHQDSASVRQVVSKPSQREGRIYEDLNGNRVELTPVPAFGSRDYELTPVISGPLLLLPSRKEQFPISILDDLKVAVHLHLHHIDLLDEFGEYLSNIPLPTSLFVSITDSGSLDEVQAYLENKCPKAQVDVRIVANRGRDIASLVTEFTDRIADHDVFAHFHSKRSMHNPAKADWRRQLLHSLLGSEALVRNILSLFVHNPQLGMVFPEYHWSLERQISWGSNFDICRNLAVRTGLTITQSKQTLFPAGSMFWARADALDALLHAELKIDDFQEEQGQVDGTTAHAIERLFGEYVRQAGFQLRQIKSDRQHSLSSYFTSDWQYSPPPVDEEKSTIDLYRRQSAGRKNRIAVYTAIVGGYDMPVIHEVLDPNIDYYLFSDHPVPDMGFWRVRSIPYHHPEPVRKARYVKTHPHVLLSEYDLTIWVDGNVLIRSDIVSLVEKASTAAQACIYGIEHPHRRCLYDEAQTLIAMGRDQVARVERQTQAYKDAGYPDESGLVETNLLAIDLRCDGTKTLLRRWWGEIAKHSHRDQLSINYSLWVTGQQFEPIFSEGHSLRSHPGFAYFAHGVGSGRWAHPGTDDKEELCPHRSISQENKRHEDDARPPIDIIVCVHDALDDVRECLRSVVEYRRKGDKIIIVDDASQDATGEYLDEFVHSHRDVRLSRHCGKPYGYCRSANVGLRMAGAEFALLLNSDAILPSRGLDKLVAAMQSSGEVAVVGPLSNAASSQSIPEIKSRDNQTAVNTLPEGVDLETLDTWCENESAGEPYPRVPLVHGFCQLIRTSVLGEIGYFDEISFPHGYGEENDFCFRVVNAGYDMLVAIDTYVFHRKSGSYSDPIRRQRLMKEGAKQLRMRYGADRLKNAVSAMETHPVLKRQRERARHRFYSEEVERT